MAEITDDQLAILRLIDAFNGRISADDLVGFAKSIGGVSDDRATAIPEHVEELKRLGLVEIKQANGGESQCHLTARGKEVAAD